MSEPHRIAPHGLALHRAGMAARATLVTALLGAVVLMSTPSAAAPPDPGATATFEKERAACMSGKTTHADRDNCLKEAAAAHAEAKRGTLSRGTTAEERRANALARCQSVKPTDKADCERLALGEGRRSGSVAEGAVVKEMVTRSVEPGASAAATPPR